MWFFDSDVGVLFDVWCWVVILNVDYFSVVGSVECKFVEEGKIIWVVKVIFGVLLK